MARFVCDQETSNEEVKARYGAVENTTKKGFNAKKTDNKTYCVMWLCITFNENNFLPYSFVLHNLSLIICNPCRKQETIRNTKCCGICLDRVQKFITKIYFFSINSEWRYCFDWTLSFLGSSVDIVTRLWAGLPRNLCLHLGNGVCSLLQKFQIAPSPLSQSPVQWVTGPCLRGTDYLPPT